MSHITTDHSPAAASGVRGVDVPPHPHTEAKDGGVDIPRHRFTEAKDGFKTSEFYVMVAFVAAVLLATYLDADSLSGEDGWRFAAFGVVAYIISRGLPSLACGSPPTTTTSNTGFSNGEAATAAPFPSKATGLLPAPRLTPRARAAPQLAAWPWVLVGHWQRWQIGSPSPTHGAVGRRRSA